MTMIAGLLIMLALAVGLLFVAACFLQPTLDDDGGF